MTTDEFLTRLDEIFNRSAGTTKRGESLADSEVWDSLAMLGLIALADGEFGVRLTGKQLRAVTNVDDILGLLAGKLT
jgi:acyl carrier protein